MSWKSTIDITRAQAIEAIMKSIDHTPYDSMSNEQLEEVMNMLEIGDDINKPYFGHNFNIFDNEKDIEDSREYLYKG